MVSVAHDMSSTPRRNYEELSIIGRGAYGTVYKARDTVNDRVVALKRVNIVNNTEEKGVPVSTLREITLLKQLDNMCHPNIVRMFDAFQTFSSSSSSSSDGPQPQQSPQEVVLTIVFEHVEQDLSTFIQKSQCGLTEDVIKNLMHQLLRGIDYLHTNRMIHRDIKPQNILITRNKQVKIADFGLARVYGFCKLVTSVVVTLWYRAPEILLRAPYAMSVDLWSVGTIMAEMYNRRPLFRGKSDVNQLHNILSVIGSPSERDWPEQVSLKWDSFRDYTPVDLCTKIPDMCGDGIDLVNKLLLFDPNKRINARKCLCHPYFDDIDGPDSQDSGVGQEDEPGHHHHQHQHQHNKLKTTTTFKRTKNKCNLPPTISHHHHTSPLRIGESHEKEMGECEIVLPSCAVVGQQQELSTSREDASSRGSDSGQGCEIDRLNASFNDTSFHEESVSTTSDDNNENISSIALSLSKSKNVEASGECSTMLTRSDSGIGFSPHPTCPQNEGTAITKAHASPSKHSPRRDFLEATSSSTRKHSPVGEVSEVLRSYNSESCSTTLNIIAPTATALTDNFHSYSREGRDESNEVMYSPPVVCKEDHVHSSNLEKRQQQQQQQQQRRGGNDGDVTDLQPPSKRFRSGDPETHA